MERGLYNQDHEAFRAMVRTFVARQVTPYQQSWEEQHQVDRTVWRAAGHQGILGIGIPEEYGGGGQDDLRFRAVVMEELAAVGAASVHLGFTLNEDIALPYFLDLATEEQQKRWLPGIATGETICAIAMTEPGAGSDLKGMRTTAKRVGDEWVIDGAKTFITNGIQADLVIVAACTGAAGSRGLSLFVVERDAPGFTRGRKLEKIGLHGQDTAELFFDGVRVPAANLLGDEEGQGFRQLMQQLARERLLIAIGAAGMMQRAIDETLTYVAQRQVFGEPLLAMQNTRFKLAECKAAVQIGRVFLDSCIERHLAGRLDEPSTAVAKYWLTEMQCRVIDDCLQLHGGYGYMTEYPIARMWADSRVQRIYAGSNEIMKELIAWSL